MAIATNDQILASHHWGSGASFPDSPVDGQVFYRTDEYRYYIYFNGVWNAIHPQATTDSLNLVIKLNTSNPTYQIDVSWEILVMNNTSESCKAFLNSGTKTVDITQSGAGGLDTGSEAASTWYYIWAIGKSDGTMHVMLSTQYDIDSITFPSGYSYARLIGAIRNDSSSDFIPGTWDSGWFNYNAGQQFYSGNGATSWTDRDVSNFIPKNISRMVIVRTGTNSGANEVIFRRDGDTVNYSLIGDPRGDIPAVLPISSDGIIEVKNDASTDAYTLVVTGYKNIINTTP